MGHMTGDGQGSGERVRSHRRWRNGFSILVLLAAAASLALLAIKGGDGSVEPSGATAMAAATSTPTRTASAARPAATQTPSPEATVTASATSTPTPSPTPTLTSTPTGTPTRTPTPTSTPIPSERLSAARHLQHNGDTSAARRALLDLLADAADGPETAEARFRLAQCFLLDELHTEAVAAFQAFLSEHPDDARRPEAHFLLGEAQAALGLWDEAILAYQAYLAPAGDLLADIVLRRVGDAYLEIGETEEALAAYEAAMAAATDLQISRSLRQRMAQLYFLRASYADSAEQYEGMLALARTPAQRAEAELRWAEVLLADDRYLEAISHLQAAADAEPKSIHAYSALRVLLDMGVVVDDYLRGVIDYHNEAYWPAAEALQRHIELEPAEAGALSYDYLARSYLALELPGQAIAVWDRLIGRFPGSDLWGDAWQSQARALRQDEQERAAELLLQRFAEENGTHAQAPQALSLAAQWVERRGDYSRAIEIYETLVERYPWSEQAAAAQFEMALNLYRVGEYSRAAAAWQAMLERYRRYRPQSTRFWKGKASLAAGDRATAGRIWQSLLDMAPEGYYAGRAESLAQAAGLAISSPLAALAAEPSGQVEAEEWLRSWLPAAETIDLGAVPQAILQDRAHARGTALLRLGMRPDALQQLEQVKDRWLHDAQAMYALALHFRDVGANGLSIRCATRLIDLSAVSQRAAAPRFLQELVYPAHFADLVEEEAQALGFDPTLIYAVIRQESLFEPQALSYAGALGLMQVMPATGVWVADRIGSADHPADRLDRAYVSVKFGVHYLAYALDFAGGDLMMALVGYNAGPGNAHYWRTLAGDDDDLYIETITNPQPREYVRGVLQQQRVYQRLHDTSE